MKGKMPAKKMPMHPMPGGGHMMKDKDMPHKGPMPPKKMPHKKGK